MSNMQHGNATKEFHDIFTSEEDAEAIKHDMYDNLKALYETTGVPVEILEPAVGTGNLIWPLLATDVPIDVHCIEIQRDYMEYLLNKAEMLGYNISTFEGTVVVSNHSLTDES